MCNRISQYFTVPKELLRQEVPLEAKKYSEPASVDAQCNGTAEGLRLEELLAALTAK